MANDTFDGFLNKTKSKLYGLLCQREKDGEWEKFLDTIVIELLGLQSELDSINYWRLLGKMQSLKFLSYGYFRKTVFECMNLLGSLDVKLDIQ